MLRPLSKRGVYMLTFVDGTSTQNITNLLVNRVKTQHANEPVTIMCNNVTMALSVKQSVSNSCVKLHDISQLTVEQLISVLDNHVSVDDNCGVIILEVKTHEEIKSLWSTLININADVLICCADVNAISTAGHHQLPSSIKYITTYTARRLLS